MTRLKLWVTLFFVPLVLILMCLRVYVLSLPKTLTARAETAAFVAHNAAKAIVWSRLDGCIMQGVATCRGDWSCVADDVHWCVGFRP